MRRIWRARSQLVLVVLVVAVGCGGASQRLLEAQRTKASADLDTIARAVSLYEMQQGRRLDKPSLKPLVGKYLMEVPQDPWGNDYAFDPEKRRFLCYGADGKPGGTGANEDVVIPAIP